MEEKHFNVEEDAILFEPIRKTGKTFYITLSILVVIILWGVYAYLNQYRQGLGITGLARPIFWGVYITNFVFFIGISHAGTLISAILRLAKAEWRRSITRSAEVITVLVLFFGVGNILMDLGRPDRMLNIIQYAQFQSPLLWDVEIGGLAKWIAIATVTAGIGTSGFCFSRSVPLSAACMALAGFGMFMSGATCNTIIQSVVDDDKRGRVMSYFTMFFIGSLPIGHLAAGFLAEKIGAPMSFLAGGIICVLAGIAFAVRLRSFRDHLRPADVERGLIPPSGGPPH